MVDAHKHLASDRETTEVDRLSANPDDVDPDDKKEDQAVVCAWCHENIREGSEPVSHGICPTCADIVRKSEGLGGPDVGREEG